MRDRIRNPRRGSRRLVSFLAFGVLLLAAWVLATNTIFGPADRTGNQAALAPAAVVEALPESKISIVHKGDLAKKTEQARAPSDVAAVAVPAPVGNASADEKAASAPPPPEGVDVAAVSPFMGGTETLLSPTLVARSVQPAAEPSGDLAPVPADRPDMMVAIPLPRPRPAAAPGAADREITEAEAIRRQVFRQQVY
ncbi:MAG: hypothetical protein R3D52_00515 [Xanthobacteraceae bacterium]